MTGIDRRDAVAALPPADLPDGVTAIGPAAAARVDALRDAHPPLTDEQRRAVDAAHFARADRWPQIVPARFAAANIGDLAGDVRRAIAGWLDSGGRRNVVILGNLGAGKTTAAAAAAREAWAAGWGVVWWWVPHLLDVIRPHGGEPDAFDRAAAAPLLVLDDVGAERPSDWTVERLGVLIGRRWDAMLPTVVTSNLTADAMPAAVGERGWSRLCHDAVRLRIVGRDRRGARP